MDIAFLIMAYNFKQDANSHSCLGEENSGQINLFPWEYFDSLRWLRNWTKFSLKRPPPLYQSPRPRPRLLLTNVWVVLYTHYEHYDIILTHRWYWSNPRTNLFIDCAGVVDRVHQGSRLNLPAFTKYLILLMKQSLNLESLLDG